jgi:hypothetical protein
MRQCIRCKEYKDESEFNWRNLLKSYRQSVCRDCQQQQGRERYEQNPENVKSINKAARERSREEDRHYVYQYLQVHPCVDCGESDPLVLTFDHVRGNKKENISNLVMKGAPIEKIQQEISLCEVVCFNCHMRREKKRRGTRYWIF